MTSRNKIQELSWKILIIGSFILLLGCGRTDSSQTTNQLGLYLSVVDVSPTGLNLMCRQSGGQPAGILKTGSSYNLERYEGKSWYSVIPINEKYWQLQLFTVEKNQDTEFNIDWEWLYGKLGPGKYRLEKEIMDVRESGNHDDYTYYVEFEINDEMPE